MTPKNTRFNNEFVNSYQYCIDNNLYLGVGNPASKILLIGKETSNDKIGFDDMSKFNLQSWHDIILNDKSFNDIGFLEDNALFPWKGQKFTIRSEKKDGTISGESGTSSTWYYYQYLTDLIYGKIKRKKEDLIDFHEFCFQSELNQLNAKQSNHIPKSDLLRINSIKDREKLFALNFFRNFEVTVLATGNYHRDFNFDIEKSFAVKWTGKTNVISKGNWYNLHYDNLENPNRILIHTRQFSTGITIELIEAIANECRIYV
ncbi:MAG: hypothetical protein CFE24_11690 [Flavobacterium sp. BFFFF2]|nr:MAG: hypothetical protein CFE24_11690 [Flavobacterium sp. BFFFF2]